MPPPPSPRPLWVIVAYTILGAFLVGACAYATLCCASGLDISGHVHGSDDAYIAYRYAKNLVAGDGLVFNPGERVEGYSNLLYVLLMTLPLRAEVDPLWFSVTVNTLCMVAAFVVFVLHLRRHVSEPAAVTAGMLFVACPSLWIWAASGLETALVFFLQLAVWVLVDRGESRDRPLGSALLGLASATLILLRADGFVTAFIVLVYLVARRRLWTAAVVGGVAAISLGGLFAWRYGYYHELLPNTYYAKVSATLLQRARAALSELRGIVAEQGLDTCLVAVPFSVVLLFLRERRNGWRRLWESVRFDLFFSVSWLAYWIDIGGDVYEERFLIILLPLGLSLLFRSILAPANEGSPGDAPPDAVRAFVVALGLVVQLAVPLRDPRYGRKVATYDRWIALGKYLGRNRSGQVLAIDAAGKVPFFSGLRTIDILGLSDRHIARVPSSGFVVGHDKADPDYVLSLRPNLIASWFDNEALDLRHGMSRKKYATAGYRLRFVVNSTPWSMGDDIIDVKDSSEANIVSLLRAGYRYAVVERDVEEP